jgi:REP element-mobilizing transposase RayT
MYHLGTRGNNRGWIFRDDVDRIRFLELLTKVVRRHGWTLLAYCLMTNHYHLVVRFDEASLSAGMQELNGAFARTFNLRHNRVGHAFERRFHDELIESDGHLLATIRYDMLNPVRARICERPEQWPWSSHRACLGLDHALQGLAVSELLAHFGREPKRARAAYRRFVDDGLVLAAAT